MTDQAKNTWAARAKRTLTSVLSVAENRRGQCVHCGACCKLPVVCPFLRTEDDGRIYCRIYPIRPLNCRKYPRSESEHITQDTCGFHFEESPPDTERARNQRSVL